jgi:hypothetical protein
VVFVVLCARVRACVHACVGAYACMRVRAHACLWACAVQRLEVMVTLMLARERPAPAGAAAAGCTALAVALTGLPSRPLEIIAEAVAALVV